MTTPRDSTLGDPLSTHPLASLTDRDLLAALVDGSCLGAVVPMALDRIGVDPLASAGLFAGDFLRALMEVPASYWGRHPRQYTRYQAALRTGAARRRQLPADQRAAFWGPLPVSRASMSEGTSGATSAETSMNGTEVRR